MGEAFNNELASCPSEFMNLPNGSSDSMKGSTPLCGRSDDAPPVQQPWLRELTGGVDTEAHARRWAEEQHALLKRSNLEMLATRLQWMTAAEAIILAAFTQCYPKGPVEFRAEVDGRTTHFCAYGETKTVSKILAAAGLMVAVATFLGVLGGFLVDVDWFRLSRKTNSKKHPRGGSFDYDYYKRDIKAIAKDMESIIGGDSNCLCYYNKRTGKRQLFSGPAMWHWFKHTLIRLNHFCIPLAFITCFALLLQLADSLTPCNFSEATVVGELTSFILN